MQLTYNSLIRIREIFVLIVRIIYYWSLEQIKFGCYGRECEVFTEQVLIQFGLKLGIADIRIMNKEHSIRLNKLKHFKVKK